MQTIGSGKKSYIGKGAGGLLTGVANGLFGGGGGMVLVPILQRLSYPPKTAHATALFLILPLCVLSAAVYLFSVRISLSLLLPVMLGNILGGLLGAKLLSVLPEKWVRLVFSLLMFFVGVRLLF